MRFPDPARRSRPSHQLLLHDDAQRERHGRAQGLPDTKVGALPQALYDETKKGGWIVISMRDDWKRNFSFDA